MACSYYAVLLAYVSEDTVFTRVVKALEAAKARIVYMDEVNRRVVANVPSRRLEWLAENTGWFRYASVELKATCRIPLDVRSAARVLRHAGFRIAASNPERLLAYGILHGRLVEIEVIRGGKVRLKLGLERDVVPPPPVPPGLFSLRLDEARAAHGLLKIVTANVVGLLRGGGQ